MASPRRLYVYYRVPAASLPAAVDAAHRLQAALAARWPGLHTELLRRPELRDGEVTLMETYAGLPDAAAFEADLIAAAAAQPGLPPQRHIERFDPITPSGDAPPGHT